jgi:hypothetical protein
MHSAGDIMTTILDLDARAETVRKKAHEDAARIENETAQRIEEEKQKFEKRAQERIGAVNAAALKKRTEEEAKVRAEFESLAASIAQKSGDKIARMVDTVVARVKGSVA